MKPERARERYILKIELPDVQEFSWKTLPALIPVLTIPLAPVASLPLWLLRFLPYESTRKERYPGLTNSLNVLDPQAAGQDEPSDQQRPADIWHVGPDARIVTIMNRESGERVLRFLAPAGEQADALLVELHRDFKRQDADAWQEKWFDVLSTSLQRHDV